LLGAFISVVLVAGFVLASCANGTYSGDVAIPGMGTAKVSLTLKSGKKYDIEASFKYPNNDITDTGTYTKSKKVYNGTGSKGWWIGSRDGKKFTGLTGTLDTIPFVDLSLSRSIEGEGLEVEIFFEDAEAEAEFLADEEDVE
jgi:hypothetical protein